MEEKKAIKLSLGTTICLIIIFVLITLLICLSMYTYNIKNSKEINCSSNTANVTITNNGIENEINIEEDEQNSYKELTASTLGNNDVLFITSAIKNNDNTYTLTGVIYKHDDENYNEAQISDRWILTDEYRTITVSKNLPCNMEYDYEDKYHTVEDVFSNYESAIPLDTSNPNYKYSFTFEFENGKCVSIKNVLTGL